MRIEARTPTRIDLAGGTLDIHPLYLFENGGLTVNVAISLYSHVTVEVLEDSRVVLESEDLNVLVEASHPEKLELGGPLDLLARAVRFYAPQGGVHVKTRNSAPKGSGLGASSSLLMALSAAIAHAAGTPATPQEFIDWGANLEAQNLGIPTGKQDYYAAIHGGILAIHFEVKGGTVERLEVPEAARRQLQERLLLTFTGISHFSGTNNWNMMKRYIDRTGNTVERLRAIKQTAASMREALLDGDLDRLAAVLDEEWQNRRDLAEGVSNPQIDAMMTAAREAGAMAGKLCGAGGGGCMITLSAPGRRAEVARALEIHGAKLLPFEFDSTGLQVTQGR